MNLTDTKSFHKQLSFKLYSSILTDIFLFLYSPGYDLFNSLPSICDGLHCLLLSSASHYPNLPERSHDDTESMP